MQKREDYASEYQAFLASFDPVTAKETDVAVLLNAMTSYHVSYVADLALTKAALARLGKTFEETKDENGKLISSTKAQAMLAATDEGIEEIILSGHVNATRAVISALSALQTALRPEKA